MFNLPWCRDASKHPQIAYAKSKYETIVYIQLAKAFLFIESRIWGFSLTFFSIGVGTKRILLKTVQHSMNTGFKVTIWVAACFFVHSAINEPRLSRIFVGALNLKRKWNCISTLGVCQQSPCLLGVRASWAASRIKSTWIKYEMRE